MFLQPGERECPQSPELRTPPMSWGSSAGLWSQVSALTALAPPGPPPNPGTTAWPHLAAPPTLAPLRFLTALPDHMCYMETIGTAVHGLWTQHWYCRPPELSRVLGTLLKKGERAALPRPRNSPPQEGTKPSPA